MGVLGAQSRPSKYVCVRLDMADTGNGPTTNGHYGLLGTPKLPNVPTYGQLKYSTLA
jgi:hypothetical protein